MKSPKQIVNNFEPWYKSHPYLLTAGILLAIAILVAVCLLEPRQTSDQPSAEELARRDSVALRVALLPVSDCLPIYVAERTGVYKRLGLDLKICNFQSQLDIDTALANNRVHMAYSDLARAIMLKQDTVNIKVIAATEGTLELVTARRGRIHQLNQLKEKMVAVSRHSITDYWSDRLTDSASLDRSMIFRPQINSLRIRTDMLCNNTMDAAFLPEPYSSEARLRGNRSIMTTKGLNPKLTAFVALSEALDEPARRKQMKLLLQGYTEVVTQLQDNEEIQDSLLSILRQECFTPDSIADSLYRQLPKMVAPTVARQTDLDAAMQWLQGRGKIRKGFTADSMIVADF